MPRRRVLVDIGPGKLELWLPRRTTPERLASERFPVDAEESWEQNLRALAARLSELVAQNRLAGAQATVIYSSPTAAAGVFSCARSAGRAAALNAARLGLAESVEFSLPDNPFALVPLLTDSARSETASPQTHVLGAADAEFATQAITDLLTGAGLRISGLVPADAVGMVQAARHATEVKSPAVRIVLHVGEHVSVLAGASEGRLRFPRRIAIGTESIAAAMARDIRRGGETPLTLDLATARQLLHRSGIPVRGRPLDESLGLNGDAVLPLIQPVLQRWLVEIKQSLRFGFEESERAAAELVGVGPGAAIPRLLELIAEQCGLTTARTVQDPLQAFPAAAWSREAPPGLNLLPRALQDQRQTRHLTRGMGVGVAAAVLLIAADAFLTRIELQRQMEENARLQSRLQAALPGAELRSTVIARQTGLSLARQRMDARMSPTVRWDAVLALLASQTPERVRLADIRLGVENGRATCKISGETPLEHSSETLKAYLDAIAATPLVSECRIGSTQRFESRAGGVQQFEMNLVLVDLPVGSFGAPRVAGARAMENGDE